MNLPPNTFDLTVRIMVTLPPGEDPETQDVPMLITGGDFNPWPGVQIHDAQLLAHQPAECVHMEGQDALWNWFGAWDRPSWLTIPRVLLHAMPDVWQLRLVALLKEYDEAFPNKPDIGTRVGVTRHNQLITTPDWILTYRHPDQEAIDALRTREGSADLQERTLETQSPS